MPNELVIRPTSITMEENTVTSIYASEEVIWSTSNASVASIKADADTVLVYAVSEGTATITATKEGGSTSSCSITVQAKEVVTFEDIKLCDTNFSILETINNNEIMSLTINKELSGDYSIILVLPASASGALSIRRGRYLYCEGQYFTMEKIVPSRSTDDIPMVTVTAVHMFFESAHWVTHPNQELLLRGNILTHLNTLFLGSSFKVTGINSSDNLYNVERSIEYSENTKMLDAVRLIFNTFGGDFLLDGEYLIIIPYGSMSRSEAALTYTVNNSSIVREIDDKDTITKLYATGGEGLDGLPLRRYVQAGQSLQSRYRRDRVEFISMNDVRVWNNFVFLTDQYMNRRKYPRVSYELDVVELKHLYPNGFNFDVGQTIRIVDLDILANEELPIKRYQYRPLEPDHLSRLVVGDKIPDITFREQRFEGQVEATQGEWRYDEIAERWIFFPTDPWDEDVDGEDPWGKEYMLWIDQVGGKGKLRYQYLPSKSAPERVKMSVQTIPNKSGTIIISGDNKSHSISVLAGESRSSIAQKISETPASGWLITKDGWDVTFEAGKEVTAEHLATTDYLVYTFENTPIKEDTIVISGNTSSYTIDYDEATVTFEHSQEANTIVADYTYYITGSRAYPAFIDTQDTGAEVSLIISQGSTAGIWTHWLETEYPLRERFSYEDEVHVEPLDDESIFIEWAGEGTGALLRRFIMTTDLDATAIYSEDAKSVQKDHTLSISKVGGGSELEYRYYPSYHSPETFSIRLYSPALSSGHIILSVDNTEYNIPVDYGESMVSIATKIDDLVIAGWESERDGWTVEYTAEDIGSKQYPATYDHNNTEAEARISVETGTTAEEWTTLRTEEYNFSKRFSTDDIVEVIPIDGNSPFVEWIGEGTGSPTRTFTMVDDLDATAIYGEDHGQTHTLLINKYGGDHYEIPGSLEWRVRAAQDQQEEVRLSINSGALESGSIVLRMNGVSRTIYVNSGESATSIAAKFEGLSFDGYTTERSDWTVTYKADEVGAKGAYSINVPWLSTVEEEDGFEGIVNISDTIKMGTTAGQHTVWTNSTYPFRGGFNTGDIVQVSPLPGKYAYFMYWTGEGTGSPTRTFTMDQSLDATAIYEGEREGIDDGDGVGTPSEMYTLAIDRHPNLPASLAYRSKSPVDRVEESTLNITKSSLVAGTFAIKIGGQTYSVNVGAYESRVSIATALAGLSYSGWTIEHVGWIIKFTANSPGAQSEPASVIPSNSLAEGRFSTRRGSIQDQWTSWTPAQFNLSERFMANDDVEVKVESGDEHTQFSKWTGEGSGSPTRTFTMNQHLDATAHFTSTAQIAVKTWDEVTIDATSVRLNAEVTQLQKYESVQRGFIWAFTDSPTIDTDDEGVMLNADGIITAGSGGLGFFDGILNRVDGANEQAILTVATGASNTSYVTINTEGSAYNVNVAEGDSQIQVADKINNFTFPGWSTTIEGYQVIFTSDIAGPLATNINILPFDTGVEAGFAISKGSLPPEDDATYYYRPYITVSDRELGADVTEYGEQGTVQFMHTDFAVEIGTRAKESGIDILPYTGIQYHADQTVLQLEAVMAAEVDLPFEHWLFYTGREERAILTITGGATSTGTGVVSLVDNSDTLVYTNIELTEGDPPTTVAQKIADATHPDWSVRRNDNQVLWEATEFKAKSSVVQWDPSTTGVLANMQSFPGADGTQIGTEVSNPHSYTVTQDIGIRAVFIGELGTINIDVNGGTASVNIYYKNTAGSWIRLGAGSLPRTIVPKYSTTWLVTIYRAQAEDGSRTSNVRWSGGGEVGPIETFRMPSRLITMSGSDVNVTLTISPNIDGLQGYVSQDNPDPSKGEENWLWFKY